MTEGVSGVVWSKGGRCWLTGPAQTVRCPKRLSTILHHSGADKTSERVRERFPQLHATGLVFGVAEVRRWNDERQPCQVRHWRLANHQTFNTGELVCVRHLGSPRSSANRVREHQGQRVYIEQSVNNIRVRVITQLLQSGLHC